jgi:hypothetical protein
MILFVLAYLGGVLTIVGCAVGRNAPIYAVMPTSCWAISSQTRVRFATTVVTNA